MPPWHHARDREILDELLDAAFVADHGSHAVFLFLGYLYSAMCRPASMVREAEGSNVIGPVEVPPDGGIKLRRRFRKPLKNDSFRLGTNHVRRS